MIIPRKPLHILSTHVSVEEAIASGHIITNPTGVFAQNVERYWGCRPDHDLIKERDGYDPKRTRLAVPMKTVRVVADESQNLKSIMSVPDMRKFFSERVSVLHEWMHSPRNWYWDKDLGEYVVFAFAPDMVQVHREKRISCLVQEMVEYRVGRFFTEGFYSALVAYLKTRTKLSDRWMEMMGRTEHKIPADLRKKVDNPAYKTAGYPFSVCKDVKEWTDRITACIKKDEHFDDYEKYYKRLGGYVMDPYNNTPIPQVQLPENETHVIRIMGDRQIGIRRRSWKLFRQKFGCSYHTFLTDLERRKQILSVSPEPLGPYAKIEEVRVSTSEDASPEVIDEKVKDAKDKEGKKFIDAWVGILASNPSTTFKDFFNGYAFLDPASESDGSINWLKSDEFPMRFHEFDDILDTNDMDDPLLEDWYWEQASVRLARHH